ncbi:MAG TPA: carboxypeptidase regulatory-like domain-containing protein [Gemmatimonadaceae bacterium]|nr:carboxypeptidase regulatory-like domain-containing protein [Gemmatimonadaceae bacterium]
MLRSRIATLAASAALMAALHPAAAAQQTPQLDAAKDTTGTVTVSGTVYDSLAGKPLADAVVQMAGKESGAKPLSTTSGADGEFEFRGVSPGSYIIGFFHPALDSLGLELTSKSVEVTSDAPARVALAIPSPTTVQDRLCTPDATADSTGLLIGFVRDANSGIPLARASVVVMWREIVIENGIHTRSREIPVKTNDAGWYALCGVRTDGPLTARAEMGSDVTGFIEISVPPRGLLHRDFYIPRGSAVTTVAVEDSAAAAAGETVRRGSARLTGMVRDHRGRPVNGAQLLVWGSGVTGSTQEDGTFALAGLPAGSQSLEVRYVGYAPEKMTVDLVSNTTRSVTVTLDERANVLDAVTVYGKRSKRSRDITGFLQRRKSGFGQFMTREDIEKRQPFRFTDLLRGVVGFMVAPSSEGLGYRILSSRGVTSSGNCTPGLYIDGVQIFDPENIDDLVVPSDIAAVEAYPSASGAPPQFVRGACGSILIWTGPNLAGAQE